MPRILLCCSGSVATVKVPEIVNELSAFSEVRILYTSNAPLHFLLRAKFYNLVEWLKFIRCGGMNRLISDRDEWEIWDKIGDPVLHIELRRWADLILVAPASADILSKISSGVCDTLVLSVLRAWDIMHKPCIICPAMNTSMWEHPSTEIALNTLESWGWILVQPAEKLLACNDKGKGALASVADIVQTVKRSLDYSESFSTYMPPNIPMLSSQWPRSAIFRYRHYLWAHWKKNRFSYVLSACMTAFLVVVNANIANSLRDLI